LANQKSFTHLFFDLDHTLWDFEKNSLACIFEIFEKHADLLDANLHPEDFYRHFSVINRNLWNQLDTGEITHQYLRANRFKLAFEAVDFELSEAHSQIINETFLGLLPHKKFLISGALEILQELNQEYTLHLISNGFEAIQTQKMQASGILGFFENVVCFDTAGARKPDKQIYNYAIEKTKASKDSCLMIGDSYVADIEGANLAGIEALHFDIESTSQAKHTVASLFEIPEKIRDIDKQKASK
jgi:YjjG family noncanonical pyrimidine nucleotidase